jgi:bifunctional DNA-binding transcriptional regulator/antitoxin component of YhaV-PrlF toxin-antitoxin module
MITMSVKYKRKLIRIGKSSLAVIIPKSWIDFNEIKYGDSVEIIVRDNIEISKKKEFNNGLV